MGLRILLLPCVIALLCIYLIAYSIKNHCIKKMLQRQEESVRSQIANTLQVAKHTDIESFYTLTAMISSLFIFLIAIMELLVDGSWRLFLPCFLTGTIVFCLLDVIIFHIRKSAGVIQGAVLFDPKEKRIYAFPSITSDRYSIYQETELIYTIERYSIGKASEKAYVFFAKKENKFAFKVGNLKDNGFEAILSQKEPANMPIPYKYQFQSLIVFLIGMICTFMLELPGLWCVKSILKSCNLSLF